MPPFLQRVCRGIGFPCRQAHCRRVCLLDCCAEQARDRPPQQDPGFRLRYWKPCVNNTSEEVPVIHGGILRRAQSVRALALGGARAQLASLTSLRLGACCTPLGALHASVPFHLPFFLPLTVQTGNKVSCLAEGLELRPVLVAPKTLAGAANQLDLAPLASIMPAGDLNAHPIWIMAAPHSGHRSAHEFREIPCLPLIVLRQ